MLLINTHNKNLWGEKRKIYLNIFWLKNILPLAIHMQAVMSLRCSQSFTGVLPYDSLIILKQYLWPDLSGVFSVPAILFDICTKKVIFWQKVRFSSKISIYALSSLTKNIYIFFIIWYSLFTHSNKCLFCFSQSDYVFCWSRTEHEGCTSSCSYHCKHVMYGWFR